MVNEWLLGGCSLAGVGGLYFVIFYHIFLIYFPVILRSRLRSQGLFLELGRCINYLTWEVSLPKLEE